MNKLKCAYCNSEKLRKANYSFTNSMDASMPIDLYVCEECSHIELFENKNKGCYFKKVSK